MKEGWEYKKLKEVGLTQTGTTPSKQIKAYYGGDIPFIRPAELNVDQNGGVQYDSELKLTEEGALKSRVIKANSVLMCCIGSVGKTGYTLNNVTCNQQINTLTPYDNYNPRFVYYALISPFFQQEVINIANSAKATLPIISKGKWEILSIPVPPLSEQQSIVDYLDSAFAKIDAMKANSEKALNEAKALFQKVLEDTMASKEGWEDKPLGDLCDIFGRIGFRGYTTKDLVQSPFDGAISLSPSNIQDGKMDYSKLTYISWFKYEESPEIKIFNGDILLVKTGSSYGKSALVQGLPHEATINPQSVVLKNCKIDNAFFAYQLRTNRVLDEFNRFVSGTAIPTFSQAKLSTVSIQYPTNEKQQSIVDTLDSLKSKVDRLQENYDKISQECDALKHVILRRVFE